MRIRSVKADYEMEAADGLTISFKIENDENDGINRIYSFDPKSPYHHLLGRLRVSDEKVGEEYEWDKPVDLNSKLRYGFLDELIENTIFKWTKSLARDPSGTIGVYRADHPAVAWMCRKETFDKVVCGQSIYDIRRFQGEIIGDDKNGNQMKFLLFNNRKAQVYLDGKFKLLVEPKNIKGATFEEAISIMEDMA